MCFPLYFHGDFELFWSLQTLVWFYSIKELKMRFKCSLYIKMVEFKKHRSSNACEILPKADACHSQKIWQWLTRLMKQSLYLFKYSQNLLKYPWDTCSLDWESPIISETIMCINASWTTGITTHSELTSRSAHELCILSCFSSWVLQE